MSVALECHGCSECPNASTTQELHVGQMYRWKFVASLDASLDASER
jgi:hypothetical protein